MSARRSSFKQWLQVGMLWEAVKHYPGLGMCVYGLLIVVVVAISVLSDILPPSLVLAALVAVVIVFVSDLFVLRGRRIDFLHAEIERMVEDEWVRPEGLVWYWRKPQLQHFIAHRARISAFHADRAISGLTVTLDLFIRETARIESAKLPFPSLNSRSRETLIHAIISATGLSVAKATSSFDAVCEAIAVNLEAARSKDKVSSPPILFEVFPLGFYEELTAERPLFSPHTILLERNYPRLHFRLKELEPR